MPLTKASAPVLGLSAYRKNFVINGNMDVWQRGTSFSATGALPYTADRWMAYASGAALVASRMTADQFSLYCLGFTGAAGNTDSAMLQRIESTTARCLSGFKVTVSAAFFTQAAGGFIPTLVLYKPNAKDDYTGKTQVGASTSFGLAPANTFTTLKASIFIPAGDTANGLEIVLGLGANATPGNIVAVTRVQLEIGNDATPFAFSHIGEELELCYRYYFKAAPVNLFGRATSTTSLHYTVTTPVAMRPINSVSMPTNFIKYDGNGISGVGAVIALANQTANAVGIGVSGLSGVTDNAIYWNNVLIGDTFFVNAEL